MTVVMTLPELEKVNTAIVVLSAVETKINLNAQEVAAVIHDPAASVIGQDAAGQPSHIEITSMRDQVIITISGGKVQFQDKSEKTPGSSRLPTIVYGFLDLLQKQGLTRYRAYGINFDVAFDAKGDQSASEVIAEKYVNKDALSQKGQINVRGAGLQLWFNHVDAVCDLKVEPRLGKMDAPRFYAHINYHFELPDETMPPIDEFKTKYHGLWPQYIEMLETLFVRP